MTLDKNYTLYLFGEVTINTAKEFIIKLFELQFADPTKTITVFLDSNGGEVQAALAIIDAIHFIQNSVRIVALGQASSMGAIILANGTRGMRCALKNTEITIHQPLGDAQGQSSDLQVAAKQIQLFRLRLNKILSESTGQPEDKINGDTERDYFMWSDAALAYGIIDHVIESISELT